VTEQSGDAPSGGWNIPRPDPSRLTDIAIERATAQFNRALDAQATLLAERISAARLERTQEIRSLREIIETRLDAIDRATVLLASDLRNVPTEMTTAIASLRELHEERFSSISQQFSERDIRTDQASKAAKEALDAALQAAKELVNAQGEASAAAAVKSETSFAKQIDQIGTIISTLEKALDARITELKERVDRGEGTQSGVASVTGTPFDASTYSQFATASQQAGGQARLSQAIAAISVIIAIVSVIIVVALHK